ncbi:SDR family oxidoreductase [Marinobacterium sediminicola]|uniref:NAD(P)-dependent dehydrogenase, short-chain alcohol dehydrogenase family n=1 Tax=Marinobacterium sediminicola TaxID=518898 RepID=A0ABY1RWK0_9GAMM|nr:SDR family oxidoreductase [Marinobacterium sediminicola]ULG70277.1 SDR family oxidoreductase [Marinobacterium sediminicola]SMR69875.1 NAD(P)-dependent dehydrogenase, short-chain alcohol dehydrogenase family [Marinobacterium sediminicola]
MSGTVLITGCNRGIGLEFAYQYARDGWRVHACARDLVHAEDLQALEARFPEQIQLHTLDVNKDGQIKALDRVLGDETIDLLINNAGYYGPRGVCFGKVERELWRQVLETNTLSPLMLTQTFYPRIATSKLKTVAFLSSKVGSISDNQSGGGYYYRSSKTALNQVIKSLSIDLEGAGVKVVALHPGWVQTDMGGQNALISAEESVSALRTLLAQLDLSQSGSFLNYDGSVIDW